LYLEIRELEEKKYGLFRRLSNREMEASDLAFTRNTVETRTAATRSKEKNARMQCSAAAQEAQSTKPVGNGHTVQKRMDSRPNGNQSLVIQPIGWRRYAI
jgi:hypothetical protein